MNSEISAILDKINSLKTQLEDLVSDLYDSDIECALLNYIDALDTAESELDSETGLLSNIWKS